MSVRSVVKILKEFSFPRLFGVFSLLVLTATEREWNN